MCEIKIETENHEQFVNSLYHIDLLWDATALLGK
jgi:hypothetical protein